MCPSQMFIGSTTMGKKGQVVIPAEARTALHLREGEKLLVFRMDEDSIVLTKFTGVVEFAHHLSTKLKDVHQLMKKAGHP